MSINPPIAKFLCPYCRINKTLELSAVSLQEFKAPGHAFGQCVFQCKNCEKLSVFEVECKTPGADIKNFLLHKRDITPYLKVINTYPPLKTEFIAYEEVPESINKAFVEAQKAFKAGAINLAGGGCRKVLDLIFKDKNIPGNNLFEKIENSELPEIVKDWAHNIRLLGNILIHEDVNLTPEEVEEIFEFTKIIIEYIYVLPTRAKALREKYEKLKTHSYGCLLFLSLFSIALYRAKI